jgi:hypothetical protein
LVFTIPIVHQIGEIDAIGYQKDSDRKQFCSQEKFGYGHCRSKETVICVQEKNRSPSPAEVEHPHPRDIAIALLELV